MTIETKFVARLMFKVEVYESKGSRFETLFVSVMQASDSRFRPVKPHGDLGDRKNDGFIKELGKYYQVYAPEDLKIKVTTAVSKAKDDFKGLKDYWDKIAKVKEFYFVLNDRYDGCYPVIEETLAEIQSSNSGITCNPFLVKDLEEAFLNLPEDKIVNIIGIIPHPNKIEEVDYTAIDEVISHLLKESKPYDATEKLIAPEFIQKIEFNDLNEVVAGLLTTANYQVSVLDDYFQRNSVFLRQTLRDKFQALYKEGIEQIPDSENKNNELFFYILEKASPKKDKNIQDAVLILMSYYFESCDIFEEPESKK